jgi:hypothetical protein
MGMSPNAETAEDAMNAMIHINGPQDGNFIVQFVTKEGRSLSILVPQAQGKLLAEFQENIPYGIAVRELVEADPEGV